MANYTIIGGDLKQYGPVTADDVRLWIAEGRLGEKSLMKVEGEAEFRMLETFPEFAGAFALKAPASEAPPAFDDPAGGAQFRNATTNWIWADASAAVGRLVKNNMGLLFVGTLVYLLIEGAIWRGGANSHHRRRSPLPISSNFLFCREPLIWGRSPACFICSSRAIRGEPAEVGDIFSGFRRAFAQLFLGHIGQGLLIGLCLSAVHRRADRENHSAARPVATFAAGHAAGSRKISSATHGSP